MAATPRRPRRLTDLFGPRPDADAATRLTLAPRRLEPRRMLDAGAGALALDLLDVPSDFVQVGEMPGEPQAAMALESEVANTAPEILEIVQSGPINEDGIVSLELLFEDPDEMDTHTVEIDWMDGSVEVFNVPSGSQFFGTTHQYLDDGLTSAPSDTYHPNVRVIDSAGGMDEETVGITVNNLDPFNLQIAQPAAINENGVGTLALTFQETGTLDTHTIEVNWGDGTVEVFNVSPGSTFFGTTHQYLDDLPGTAPAEEYAIGVRVIDDDTGEVAGSTKIVVNNLPPALVSIDSLGVINENDFAQLNLAFTDPGTLDTHTVEIDWGDGSPLEILPATAGSPFNATHQYLDDPAGAPDTYQINVRVVDDDGGFVDAATQTVTVNNVAPAIVDLDVTSPIDENGVALLELAFTDPGTLDAHTVEIDWGDGSALQTISLPAGSGLMLTASHQYLDDKPIAPPNNFTVKVRIIDDDSGEVMASQSITVNNVAPQAVVVMPDATMVDEGSPLTLSFTFSDPGTLDAHTYEVDWGDGDVTPGVVVGHSFAATHTYADDGIYAVKVKVVDDSGGVGMNEGQVTVANVVPTLTVTPSPTSIDEGRSASFNALFSDPGFDNPLNPTVPATGDPLTESFRYALHWGDGRDAILGQGLVDANGMPSTGSFSGSHTYADDGMYTVTVRLADDNMSGDFAAGINGVDFVEKTFTVSVANVVPTLTVTPSPTSINEGQSVSFNAPFSDPGFDNPLNPAVPATGDPLNESFRYALNWGDGRDAILSQGVLDDDGQPSTGSFAGSHTYADDGTYTVTVRLADDNMSGDFAAGINGVDFVEKTFTVSVANVDPALRGTSPTPEVNEGQAFTLVGLGVGIEDPGFDNALNAGNVANGGEVEETFTGVTVDWGDGTAIDALSMTNRVSGAPGVLTTADFVHDAHTYADNGAYAITLKLSDDDGAVVTRTLTIIVHNVAPSLTLTGDSFVIDEGSTLSIPNLGAFTDPGFDNLLNAPNAANGGESTELLTYTIDWGDGAIEALQAPATRVSGSPGVLTMGTLADSHFYADNDADNHYTIKVTLSDDDGGQVEKFFEIVVNNVNPTLQPVFSTAVNTLGQTTLTLEFSDPGADSFEVLIDWGDKLALPPAERFVVETMHAGSTPQSFALLHSYSGPPDPLHPAADIAISVKIRDDDFGTPFIFEAGESNVETTVITNPGLGAAAFRIDTTPDVALLSFPDRVVATGVIASSEVRVAAASSSEVSGSAGDSRAASERFLELRVINPDGTLGEGFRLQSEVLNNLPGLFRNLPDNHYAIYLVQSETNVRRLVIEVFVRNGKLIDPGDDSEGARDRPPTDESTIPGEGASATRPGEEAPASEQGAEELLEPAQTLPGPSSSTLYHRAALAGVALAISAAGRNWRRDLEQTLAKAKPDQWKRLRTAGHRRRQKPR